MLKYEYPLNNDECKSYSDRIKNYRKLTIEDKTILKNNIVEFTKYVYYMLNLPHPTYDQMYMSKYVGKTVNTTDRLMVQAQRGLAKSLTSQILVVWLLYRYKEEKIAVLSATRDRATSWTTFTLNLIRELPLTKHMYPNSKQRRATDKFDINGCLPSDSPSVGAYSITGQKTGMRATFLVYDDVEIPENSDTAGKREKLSKSVRDATHLGIAHIYRSLCLCTPQSSETVYNDMLERGYKRTVIPAEYPKDINAYGGDLAPHILDVCKKEPHRIGEATDKRLNEKHLVLKRLESTTSEYKLQYMLDTSLSDEEKYPLKLRDMIVMDLDVKKSPLSIQYGSDKNNILWDIKHSGFPNDKLYSPRYCSFDSQLEYEGIMMFIDPSGQGKDQTGYAITAQLSGKIFLLDFGGISGGYKFDNLEFLANKAKEYSVKLIQVESNFGDGSFGELLKPVTRRIYDVSIEQVRATTNKEKRIIEILEPILNQHRLIVNKAPLINDYLQPVDYRFTYQITHIMSVSGSLKHDDVIDAVAWAVKYWKDSLARDEKKELDRLREIEKEKKFEEFMIKHKIGKYQDKKKNCLDKFGSIQI